jgi:excisionase family DNA binding protein
MTGPREPDPTTPPARLHTIAQVSGLTGVPASTIAQWAQQERIEAQKWGKLWYVNIEDVERTADTLRPGPKPK